MHLPTPRTTPARILAILVLALAGFAFGIALFMPWDKLWTSVLVRFDEELSSAGFSWESMDREGPLSFRLVNLEVAAAGMPGVLRFEHAYVRMGNSPLAKVRLDTGGPQCTLGIYRNGRFEFEGELNLTYLFGHGDYQGQLHASGSLFLPAGAVLPKKGWVDLRSQQLILPRNRMCRDFAFTAEVADADVRIRDFTIAAPLAVRAGGSMKLSPTNLFASTYAVQGERDVNGSTIPYASSGILADVLE